MGPSHHGPAEPSRRPLKPQAGADSHQNALALLRMRPATSPQIRVPRAPVSIRSILDGPRLGCPCGTVDDQHGRPVASRRFGRRQDAQMVLASKASLKRVPRSPPRVHPQHALTIQKSPVAHLHRCVPGLMHGCEQAGSGPRKPGPPLQLSGHTLPLRTRTCRQPRTSGRTACGDGAVTGRNRRRREASAHGG